jgi:hypothetical protein
LTTVPAKSRSNVAASAFLALAALAGAHDVDRSGVERVLEMRGVEFFDHLDAGATILGDLIDVCPLHEPHADVSMTQGIGNAILAVSAHLEVCALKDAIEGLLMVVGDDLLKPAAEDVLQKWPVSKRVNSSRAPDDDPTLTDKISL